MEARKTVVANLEVVNPPYCESCPSINLLPPMEPLTEEDDITRETSCEATVTPEGIVLLF